MKLAQWSVEKKRAAFERLTQGLDPAEGTFDPELLKNARMKGVSVQMGSTTYAPEKATFEFIYPDPRGAAVIVSVHMDVPERIVFLPVPGWVIESIWQGDISGSYYFESEANQFVQEFLNELTTDGNQKWFEKQMAKRRE